MLDIEGFLEKSLKIKSALKSIGKSFHYFENPRILLFSVGPNSVNEDMNQCKIV